MSELSPELKLLREQIIKDLTILIDEKLLNYQKSLVKPDNTDSSHSDLDSLESESSNDEQTEKQSIIDRLEASFKKGFSVCKT